MTVDELVEKLSSGELKPKEAARQITATDDFKQNEDKKLREMFQLAREILHYEEQLTSAPTSQWQASFHFEMMQSEKALTRIAKQLVKKRAS